MGKTKAALICTLGVTLLLIVPVMMVMLYAAREAIDASARFQALLGEGSQLCPGEGLNYAAADSAGISCRTSDFMGALRQGGGKSSVLSGGQHGRTAEELVLVFRESVHSVVRVVLHVSGWGRDSARSATPVAV